MKYPKLVLVLVMLFAMASLRAEDNSDALATASKWLSMVDHGNYAGSWQEASAYFRAAVTQEKWKTSLQAARAPLGKFQSRSLKSATRRKSLPGAPDGDYLVMQFNAVFTHKAAAVETVTFMKTGGEDWQAAGYYIR